MDTVELIARENEFKKLNKQLEKKTESLMKEIEEVMQKSDIFSGPSLKLNLYNNKTSTRKYHCNNSSPLSEGSPKSKYLSNTKPKDSWNKNHRDTNTSKIIPDFNNATEHNLSKEQNQSETFQKCNTSADYVTPPDKVLCDCCVNEKINDELGFLYAFVSVSVKDKLLPQSFLKGKVTVESVCKCLSAKIKLIQEQLDRLQSAAEKQNRQCEAHLAHAAELESERLSVLNTANAMKSEAADMRAKYLAVQNRLDEKDRLYKEQRSATDKLTLEIKQYRCKNGSLEARCASQEETIAGLRQQLEAAKLSEKEYRSSTRSLSSSHEATIKRLEAHLSTLRTRISQQRALIENLRSQRTLISAERDVRSLNAQYCSLLEDGR